MVEGLGLTILSQQLELNLNFGSEMGRWKGKEITQAQQRPNVEVEYGAGRLGSRGSPDWVSTQMYEPG